MFSPISVQCNIILSFFFVTTFVKKTTKDLHRFEGEQSSFPITFDSFWMKFLKLVKKRGFNGLTIFFFGKGAKGDAVNALATYDRAILTAADTAVTV